MTGAEGAPGTKCLLGAAWHSESLQDLRLLDPARLSIDSPYQDQGNPGGSGYPKDIYSAHMTLRAHSHVLSVISRSHTWYDQVAGKWVEKQILGDSKERRERMLG